VIRASCYEPVRDRENFRAIELSPNAERQIRLEPNCAGPVKRGSTAAQKERRRTIDGQTEVHDAFGMPTLVSRPF